jgi:hypothetical protein
MNQRIRIVGEVHFDSSTDINRRATLPAGFNAPAYA